MNKLKLQNVTLVCVDDMLPQKSLSVVEGVSNAIDFADVKFLSSKQCDGVTDKIKPLFNIRDYNIFIVKEIYKYINTEFCMFIQRDGYPLNIDMWTDDFLKYDYIGAPWTWAPPEHKNGICRVGKCVGNGGFSIRSRKLLEEASKLEYNAKYPSGDILNEDMFLCQFADEELKPKGITYAPVELAGYFSVENKVYNGEFGFHGHETIKLNKEQGIFTFSDHAYE